jgi:hypothetical protein
VMLRARVIHAATCPWYQAAGMCTSTCVPPASRPGWRYSSRCQRARAVATTTSARQPASATAGKAGQTSRPAGRSSRWPGRSAGWVSGASAWYW